MLYRSSVAERGLTGIANIFRSRMSGLDDLLRAGTVPLKHVKAVGSPSNHLGPPEKQGPRPCDCQGPSDYPGPQ